MDSICITERQKWGFRGVKLKKTTSETLNGGKFERKTRNLLPLKFFNKSNVPLQLLLLSWFRKRPNIFLGAGLCWLRRLSDETCSGFLREYNDEKECCGNGGVAFSNGASRRRIFFHIFVQRPSCKLCNSKSLPCYIEFTLPTFFAHLLSSMRPFLLYL